MSKGFDFERKMCKRLSLWWSGGKDPDIFWRTKGSGGRATSAKRKTLTNYGDMQAEKPEGQPAIDFAIWEFKKGFTSMGRIKPGALDKLNYEVQQMGLTAFVRRTGKGGKIVSSPFMSKISGFIQRLKKSGKFDLIDFIDSTTKKQPLFWDWWEEAERDRKAAGRPWIIMIIMRDGKKPIVAAYSKLFAMIWNVMDEHVEVPPAEINLFYKGEQIKFCDADVFFDQYLTPKHLRILQNMEPKRKIKRRRRGK